MSNPSINGSFELFDVASAVSGGPSASIKDPQEVDIEGLRSLVFDNAMIMFPQEVHRYRRTEPQGRDADAFRISITTLYDNIPDNWEGKGFEAYLSSKIPEKPLDQELAGGDPAPTKVGAIEMLLENLGSMLADVRAEGRYMVSDYEPIRAPGTRYGDINREKFEEGRRFEARAQSTRRQDSRPTERQAGRRSNQRTYRTEDRERREKSNQHHRRRNSEEHRKKAGHQSSRRTDDQHRTNPKQRSSNTGDREHRDNGEARQQGSEKPKKGHRKGSGVSEWLRRMSQDLGLGSR